jgi:hypothetical protein
MLSSSESMNIMDVPALHKKNMQNVLNAITGIKCDICCAHLCDKEYKDACIVKKGIYVCSQRCASIAIPLYKNVPY